MSDSLPRLEMIAEVVERASSDAVLSGLNIAAEIAEATARGMDKLGPRAPSAGDALRQLADAYRRTTADMLAEAHRG